MLIFSTDKKRLLAHFKKDEVLFSYHLGDLDDFFFPDCQWLVSYGDRAHIEEAILLYTGGDTPSLLAFGVTDKLNDLLTEAVDLLPPAFYCHFHARSREILGTAYAEKKLGTFVKMKLSSFTSTQSSNHDIIRLDEKHEDRLRKLYSSSYPGNYFTPRMLKTGKYFGIIESGEIVAVAGVHVYSPEYKIAVLGNIVTSVEQRGQGLGSSVTARLVEELVSENLLVCLNVKADNVPAIKCYQRLGFEKVHEYEESFFQLK